MATTRDSRTRTTDHQSFLKKRPCTLPSFWTRVAAASLLSLGIACSEDEPRSHRDSKVFEAWDVINEPTRFGRRFELRLSRLPSQGKLAHIPWSDSYWPTQKAGIAFRWQNAVGSPFSYVSPTRMKLRTMSQDDIAKLSPAEKLDIYNDRFDYPTVLSERKRTYPGAAAWEGLCHGWAPAALEFKEPMPVTLRGRNGISVPFGSSDIKALLTWHMATKNTVAAIGLGARCQIFGTIGLNTPSCRDANAGAFHVVLTNQLGIFKEGIIADVARMGEVWNQPVYQFESKQLSRRGPSPGSAPGTTDEVVIETVMHYTIEIQPQWSALGQLMERPLTRSVVYRYRVELNRSGEILGGVWLQDDRPDFIWLQRRGAFLGTDASIQEIYEASLRTEATMLGR